MTGLVAKAAAMALVQHPVVQENCKDGKSFTYSSIIKIAVAVAIDGLLVTWFFWMQVRFLNLMFYDKNLKSEIFIFPTQSET